MKTQLRATVIVTADFLFLITARVPRIALAGDPAQSVFSPTPQIRTLKITALSTML